MCFVYGRGFIKELFIQRGNSSPPSQAGQALLPVDSRSPESPIRDPSNLSQVQKKPRIDIKQEDIIQQQIPQQLRHSFQQQRLRQQQQQVLQSMPRLWECSSAAAAAASAETAARATEPAAHLCQAAQLQLYIYSKTDGFPGKKDDGNKMTK